MRIKRFLCVLIILMLQACAVSPVGVSGGRSDFHQAALMGNVDELRRVLPSVININSLDDAGFGAVHYAATTQMGNPADTLRVLLQAGANPNLPLESASMTPLFFASSAEIVNILVDAGADVNYRAIDKSTPIHHAKTADSLKALLARGADPNAKNMMNKTARESFQEMLPHFEKNPALSSIVEDYKNIIAILGGDVSLASAPVNSFVSPPKEQTNTFVLSDLNSLIASQPCPMSNKDWIYTGELCEKGLAHGQGSAVSASSSQRFEGLIEAGVPVKGILYEQDTQLYDGDFEQGLAHGNGICFYQNNPEECRYYKGQRIDTLHKQRKEFERQQAMLNKRPAVQQPVRQVVQQPAQTNTLGDVVGDQILEQGAKFLFDQLF